MWPWSPGLTLLCTHTHTQPRGTSKTADPESRQMKCCHLQQVTPGLLILQTSLFIAPHTSHTSVSPPPLGLECGLCRFRRTSVSTLHSLVPAASLVFVLWSLPWFLWDLITSVLDFCSCLLTHPHPQSIILHFVAMVISLNMPLTIIFSSFVRELA